MRESTCKRPRLTLSVLVHLDHEDYLERNVSALSLKHTECTEGRRESIGKTEVQRVADKKALKDASACCGRSLEWVAWVVHSNGRVTKTDH